LKAANKGPFVVGSFCWIIAVSGCRISEALALTAENIDFEGQSLVVESLKKRRRRVYRSIPLPPDLILRLRRWIKTSNIESGRLWPWSRMTGYRRVCEVMEAAGVFGDHATPKGLRHGFGVRAIQAGVPLNMVQRWLGHADLKTTAIYASATGPEERAIAARMWRFANQPSEKLTTAPQGRHSGRSGPSRVNVLGHSSP